MRFRVISNVRERLANARDIAYLLIDGWDDWFEFNTLYHLSYVDADGEDHNIGGVKIGQFEMPKRQRRPELPNAFPNLNARFFSLGQDVTYYEALRELSPGTRNALLSGLNDVVADHDMYRLAREERVMGVSLMRSVTERSILGQFRRVLEGGASLTPFKFRFTGPTQLDARADPLSLSFEVQVSSRPPTNIQVIVGRNGVGKSFLLNAMARALVRPEEDDGANGVFFDEAAAEDEGFVSPFSNVLSVTFSAFDDFPIVRAPRNALDGVRYTNIGLRKLEKETDEDGNSQWHYVTQDAADLSGDFIASAKACLGEPKRERWLRALRSLETDPIFENANVTSLLDEPAERVGRAAGRLYRLLSSGHKIVLLTITKLVESTEERTLVLMDEPEAHLHPPLLAAFVRALSDLLTDRNGVAIVATHSPVLLQEVPRSCVWKIRRQSGRAFAERPLTETFAEHVGNLTHEVFGLEVMRSGFHKMISDAVGADDDFDDVVAKFDHEVGSEGRALISALIALRDAERAGAESDDE